MQRWRGRLRDETVEDGSAFESTHKKHIYYCTWKTFYPNCTRRRGSKTSIQSDTEYQGSIINMTSLTIRLFTDGLERNAIHVRNAWTSLTVKSQLTDIAQIRACFFDTLDERLLTFANPDTGVVVLKMRYECMITMEVTIIPSCLACQVPRGFQPGSGGNLSS